MTDERDPDDVLHRLVPADLADRLLAGPVDAVDVTPAVDEVAALLEGLRAPETLEERAAGSTAAATFAATVRAGTADAPQRITAMPVRRPRAKAIAAIATVTVLSVGTAAAAATGGVTGALSRIGIELRDRGPDRDGGETADPTVLTLPTTLPPIDPSTTAAAPTTAASSTTAVPTTAAEQTVTVASPPETSVADVPPPGTGEQTTPVGPDPTGAAHHGLCTAFFASGAADGPNGDSVAMRNVVEAAAAAGQTVEEFCADVIGDDAERRGNGDADRGDRARDGGQDEGRSDDGRQNDDGAGNGNGRENGNGRDNSAERRTGERSPGRQDHGG